MRMLHKNYFLRIEFIYQKDSGSSYYVLLLIKTTPSLTHTPCPSSSSLRKDPKVQVCSFCKI